MKNRPSQESSYLLVRNQRGFTLLELMITVTVLGILLGLAVPSFREAIRNNRIVAQNNEFITALTYARSEAIRRSDTVSICSSTNGTSCSTTTNWSTGWITFVDPNADGLLNNAEVVMQTSPPVIAGFTLTSVTGSLANIRFSGNGMLNSAAGTFQLQKTSCTGITAREIAISVTGRASTKKVVCT
ncbi:MAG: GspH/FimT family pseudopilin [Pseudomonadota bacterium]